MTSATIALRRLRRPPTRLLYYVVYGLALAAIFGHLMLRLFERHFELFAPFAAALYALQLTFVHGMVGKAWNAWLEDVPAAPVAARERASLAFLTGIAVWVWVQ
jgi:hypothetical protein